VGAAAGRAVWLRTEAELDVVTALSGSGPAYFFLLAEQMAQAAAALGLAPATAALLAAETLYGAGLLAHEGHGAGRGARRGDLHAAAPPKRRYGVLQQGGFDALIARALQAAASERSAQLADMLASTQPTEPE
jgi:pyrroline-5-carboxylate reductase